MKRWQVARLTAVDVVRLTWLLLALALVRGLDYASGHDSKIAGPPPQPIATGLGYAPRSTLVGIEAAFPLWIWGVMFLLSCAGLGIGLLKRWHSWIWWAHVALSVLYLGLTVGLAYGYLGRPWFDGIRTAAGLAFPASLHALLWWRMGFQPLDEESRPATFGGARA